MYHIKESMIVFVIGLLAIILSSCDCKSYNQQKQDCFDSGGVEFVFNPARGSECIYRKDNK